MKDLIEALKTINHYHNLGDAIYQVRDRVWDIDPEFKGDSWDHPSVLAYSEAVEIVEKYIDEREEDDPPF